jgi:hypothetical protein
MVPTAPAGLLVIFAGALGEELVDAARKYVVSLP